MMVRCKGLWEHTIPNITREPGRFWPICVGAWLFVVLMPPVSGYSELLPEQVDNEMATVELTTESREVAQGSLPDDESKQAVEPTIPLLPVSKISTSRPSFTDAAITVPKGSLQAENGATYTDNADGTRQWTLPETLLRFGITNNTELRFTTPNYIHLRQGNRSTQISNFGDISVGIGQHLLLPGKVDLAVFPLLYIPTGGNVASSNALDPEVRLVLARNLTPKLQVSSMVASRWSSSRNVPQNAILTPTMIAYYSFTDKLTAFLEYACFIPVGHRDGGYSGGGPAQNTHFIQSGLLYVVKQRHQFDVRMAAGLNHASPDILVGFGYSFRLDGLLFRD